MGQTLKLLERIERLQNSSKNLGWGHCVLDPMLNSTVPNLAEQYIIVCGHSHYRQIKTLLLEVYTNGSYGLYHDELVKDKFDVIVGYGDEETILSSLISRLKMWFPAVISETGGHSNGK